MRNLTQGVLLLGILGGLACSTAGKFGSGGDHGESRPGVLTQTEAQNRVRQIHRVSYNLWFNVTASEGDFQGRTTLNFSLRDKARDAGSELFVDFEGGQIQALRINDVAWTPQQIADRYDGHRIRLKLSELKAAGNRVEVTYSHPFGRDGNGLHRFKDPVDERVYLYTDLEPYDARRVFPCFDQPDLKASYELTVEAPKDWEVIANTQERAVTPLEERKSWQFPPSPVFSTYVFALHAGPYAKWKSESQGIPLRLFARKSLAQYVDHREWFEVTRQGLDFFSVQFGTPYPYGKYDQLIVPDFNAGAMENVAAVTFSERAIFRSKVTDDARRARADTILHEMAHMWFGNLVTMRWWNGLWLNESFATFAAAWGLDQATRFKAENQTWQAFFAGMKQWAYWEDQLVTTHPIEVPVPDTDQAFSNFDGITYGKGAAALKQLAFYLGEDDFREGLQRYFERYARRNTTLSDFIGALSEASGENLTQWQNLWLKTPGMNTLEADWACEPNPRNSKPEISRFVLKQGNAENSSALRPHRTQVALYAWTHPKTRKGPMILKDTLTVDYSGAETAVEEAIGLACPAFVFPNHGDYDYVKVVLDPTSLKVARRNLAQFEDAFARQMLWHTLWEMVRDGGLAAQDYADTVISQVAAEKNTQVLSKVLRTLVRASADADSALKLMDPAVSKKYRPKVQEFIKTQLNLAPGGSDLQLVWYQAYLSAAHTPRAMHFLEEVLEGKIKIKGFDLEQERRWELIQAMARNGADEVEEFLSDELTRDATETGRLQAISAEVQIPRKETKRVWLSRITRTSPNPEDQSIKLSHLGEAMESFYVLGQEEVTRIATDPYFETLEKLLKGDADEEYVQMFSSDMFPPYCEQDVIDRARAFLGKHEHLPSSMSKALRIGIQEAERCIRAREKSAAPTGKD